MSRPLTLLTGARKPPTAHLRHARPLTTSREKLRYIPQKVKEEMIGLHEEDGSRWTSTTLSARYSARVENVAAILKMAGLRDGRFEVRGVGWREVNGEGCGVDEAGLAVLREGVRDAWGGLAEVGGAGGVRRVAKASERVEEVVVGEEGEGEEEVVVVEEKKKKSCTAEWIERVCGEEGFAKDVARKTSFAFIEVGGKGNVDDLYRGVWIRDGKSGEMRIAGEEEREILLGNVRAIDGRVWG